MPLIWKEVIICIAPKLLLSCKVEFNSVTVASMSVVTWEKCHSCLQYN